MNKSKALLFGLNYSYSSCKLNGCINDINYMNEFIRNKLNIPTEIYTDDINLYDTSYDGFLNIIRRTAYESHIYDLDFVWIHYSGHGSNKTDLNGDEKDNKDEGLVPSDYEEKGIIIDDILNDIFSSFNPKTKILFICDACHSGTIIDLKYTWDDNIGKIDNNYCKILNKMILISGCRDDQTSADSFGLMGDNKSCGALTSSFLNVLNTNPHLIYDIFNLNIEINKKLKSEGFTQCSQIRSTYNLLEDKSLLLYQPTPPIQYYYYQPPQQQPIQYYYYQQPIQYYYQ